MMRNPSTTIQMRIEDEVRHIDDLLWELGLKRGAANSSDSRWTRVENRGGERVGWIFEDDYFMLKLDYGGVTLRVVISPNGRYLDESFTFHESGRVERNLKVRENFLQNGVENMTATLTLCEGDQRRTDRLTAKRVSEPRAVARYELSKSGFGKIVGVLTQQGYDGCEPIPPVRATVLPNGALRFNVEDYINAHLCHEDLQYPRTELVDAEPDRI